MHIRFLPRGTGTARDAKRYLLQKRNHSGKKREDVQVLRGNPELVTKLADSLTFKYKYTSGVIAWHKEDKPTPTQIEEVLDSFEKVAFAGLNGNQYTYYAVWHGEANGSGHIHIVVARVELQTGKSLNIAPPGWQTIFDLMRDQYNIKYEWARPDELSRKRLVNNQLNIHANLPANQAKEMINDTISNLVQTGLIINHNDVKSFLGQHGEITREGENYISLKPEGFKKAIRLKGAVYERGFELDKVISELGTEQKKGTRTNKENRERELKRINSELERAISSRAQFNKNRFKVHSQRNRTGDQSISNSDQQPSQEFREEYKDLYESDQRSHREYGRHINENQKPPMDNAYNNWGLNHTGLWTWSIRPWDINLKPQPNTNYSSKRARRSPKDKRYNEKLHTNKDSIQQRNRVEKGVQGKDGYKQKWTFIHNNREVNDDTIRTRIEKRVNYAKRHIRNRTEKHHEAIREKLRKDNESIREYSQQATKCYHETKRKLPYNSDRSSESFNTTREKLQNRNSKTLENTRRTNTQCKQLINRTGKRLQRFINAFEQFRAKLEDTIKRIIRIKSIDIHTKQRR